ncbi:MAG: gamma-glutamyltransferase [Bacteroidetes bacterium]|nr:gamma-glutamyltransferase [Bacteroidota bacterium]
MILLLLTGYPPAHAQDFVSNAGTLVHARGGMVVSASPEASAVGAAVLRAGGNAVDAALATGFALAVTYPSAGNIGGGSYILIRMADGRTTAIDARETAPAAAHRDMYVAPDGELRTEASLYGPLAGGVPGTVDGLLLALERYGTFSREDILRPAIAFARDGFLLHPRLARAFRIYADQFRRYPSTWGVFAPGGVLPRGGTRWKQPDLASVLQRISAHGRDGFYRGETARLIAAAMRSDGGLITEEDLAAYTSVEREPLQGRYGRYDILSMPPSSSGGVVLLQMLGMIERAGRHGHPSGHAVAAQYMIEAMRRAFADRAIHLGDPAFHPVPTPRLLSPVWLDSLFISIDTTAATPSGELYREQIQLHESPQTTHYSVVDSRGNAVSVTTTINSSYGSKYIVPGCGFLLNNEMDDFAVRPGLPNQFGLIGGEANSIAAGKRMLSSMTPTIVMEGTEPRLILGSPGGSRIITTVLQVLMNVLDHGMALDTAIRHPRFHHQWYPDIVFTEKHALTPAVRRLLIGRGYNIQSTSRFGRVDAILLRADGSIMGCSDPRGFGAAISE